MAMTTAPKQNSILRLNKLTNLSEIKQKQTKPKVTNVEMPMWKKHKTIVDGEHMSRHTFGGAFKY